MKLAVNWLCFTYPKQNSKNYSYNTDIDNREQTYSQFKKRTTEGHDEKRYLSMSTALTFPLSEWSTLSTPNINALFITPQLNKFYLSLKTLLIWKFWSFNLEYLSQTLNLILDYPMLQVSLPCRPSDRVIKANCPSKLATFMLTLKISHAKTCLYYCYLICYEYSLFMLIFLQYA